MSGQLRTRIGTIKRVLQRRLDFAVPYMEERKKINGDDLRQMDDETLTNELTYLEDTRIELLKVYSKLDDADKAWKKLMEEDPMEKEIQQLYFSKCGNYTSMLTEAEETLNAADTFYSALTIEASARQLDIPSIPDDDSSYSRRTSVAHEPVVVQTRRQEDLAGCTPGSVAATTPEAIPSAASKTVPNLVCASVDSSAEGVRAVPSTGTPSLSGTSSTDHVPVTVHIESTKAEKVDTIPPLSPSVITQTSQRIESLSLQEPRAPSRQHHNGTPSPPVHAPTPIPSAAAIAPSLFLQSALVGRAQLPSFNGDLVKWPPFKDSFLALLGDATLPGCHKLALLKSCLSGEPLQLISGLSQIDQEYDTAMSILNAEYDRPTLIRHALMTRLQSVQDCDSSGKQLRRIYMEFTELIHQLCPEGDIDCPEFLVNTMICKLPTFLQTRIMREAQRKKVGVFAVLNMMRECVDDDRIEQLLTVRPSHKNAAYSSSNHPTRRQEDNFRPPKKKEFVRNSDPLYHCRLCNGAHIAKNCDQYKTRRDKRIAAVQKRLCLNCLKSDHKTHDCTNPTRCRKCGEKHHTLVCNSNAGTPQNTKTSTGQEPTVKNNTRPVHHQKPHHQSSAHFKKPKNVTNFVHSEECYDDEQPTGDVTLRITTSPTADPEDETHSVLLCLDVNVASPDDADKKIPVTLLIDTGSTKSYVSKDFATELNLPILEQKMKTVFIFDCKKPINRVTTTSPLLISLPDGTQEKITLSTANFICPTIDWAEKTNGVIIPRQSKPTILLGMDLARRFFFTAALRTEIFTDHIVVHTELGPCVSIEKNISTNRLTTLSTVEPTETSSPIDTDMEEDPIPYLWSLEPLGIFEKPTEDSDTKCYDEFRKTTTYDGKEKRYYVRLPIIDDPANIPSNYKMAYARLHSNYAELSKNPGLLQKYDQIFQDQLDAGIIEEVPRDEFHKEFRTHYLPHQGVIKESSATTKLRMVLDGSSHTHGMGSINDNLHRGPVLVPDLLGVLLRTRLPSILISGDLEKAFHSVGLHKDDRDFTRLLWVKDTTLPPSQSNLRIFRFARVPFGLNSSPFLLSGTLLHHMDSNPSEYGDVIRRMIYVDNVFMGAESEEECKKIYNDLRHLFSTASMNIREFFSNSSTFNEFVQEHGTGVEDLSKAKVLGVNWDPVSDRYSLARVKKPDDSTIWTKRKALRYSASYWDILGIIAPVTMLLKRFIQLLWKDTYTWDQPLSADHSSTLWKLIDQFESVDNISIPRMAIPRPIDGALIELHCYCDASAAAYCAVIYLVVRRADGSGVSHFLTSKVRISPKDPVPIPRLELLGNLMGALLTATVIRELDLRIDRIFVWTDSSICLHWITQPKTNLPVFIRNRIKQIREALPTTTEFLHIDGKMNPADIGSRGCSAQELIDSTIWWHGPSFLTSHRSKWPVKNLLPVKADVTLLIPSSITDSSSLPIPVENFSSWTRLLHVTRSIIAFAAHTNRRLREKFGASKTEHIRWSRIVLFRLAQKEFPPAEHTQKLLHLFIDETTGLWMRHTRTGADLVYLPREGHITRLYVLHLHTQISHGGMDHTLLKTREFVWIPKGRTSVKTIINSHCPQCSKAKARPYTLPPFKDHPEIRTNPPLHPYSFIGMDMAGPLYYRTTTQAKEKYWILLITCLNSRSVHLDLVTDLTTKTLLNALRRFVSVYGAPKSILADNFKSHISLDECLKTVLDPSTDQTIVDYCASNGIDFHFITPGAPWEGGLYERLIGSVKKSLSSTLGRSTYGIDDTLTILKEVEAIVNSRPLSYVSSEGDITPLRPMDFTRPWAKRSLPRLRGEKEIDDDWNPIKTSQQILESGWKSTLECINDFWNRWKSEYHSAINERYKETHSTPRSTEASKPRQGDVVLVQDDNLDRGQWRLGQLIGSKDDYTRSAIVRLATGGSISRPINRLHKIEIPSEKAEPPPEPPKEDEEDRQQRRHPMVTRSRSTATALQLIMLACLAATSFATKCPSSSTDYSTSSVIHAPRCAKEGPAIIVQHSDRSLCWYPVNCPIGAITITEEKAIKCSRCSCPDWADGCSPSNSSHTRYSTADHLPAEFANHYPDDYCSSAPSSNCSTQVNTVAMAQIELFDHSVFMIPSLDIRTTDYIHSEDYICFNADGERFDGPVDPPFDGTSQFCLHHSCTVNSKIFCAYDAPVTQLASLIHRQPPLLLYAWGYRLFKYHPTKETAHPPLTAHLECTTGGGIITSSESATISACIANFCQYHPSIKSTSVFFPTEMVVRKYTLIINLQTPDGRMQRLVKDCSAQPFCESIRCWICWEKILNYRCLSTMNYIVILATLLGATSIMSLLALLCPIIYFMAKMIQPFFWCIRLLHSIINNITVRIRRLFKKREEPLLPTTVRPTFRPPQPIRQRNNYVKFTAAVTVIIALSLPSLSIACSETTTQQATTRACTETDCLYSETTRMTLLPYGQQSCLAFRRENTTDGFISITAEDLHYQCHQRSLYFTRDHRLDVTSTHRCSTMGECTGSKCEKVKHDSMLSDIPAYANNAPGYTFCASSCNCAVCGGCFLCDSSCLFYRLFASPTSSKNHEVFSCPTWEPVVKIAVSFKTALDDEKTTLTLSPGSSSTWKNLKFTLTSITTPALPILHSEFITDGTTTAMLLGASKTEPTPNSPSQLMCPTRDDATEFRCKFGVETCKCSTSDYSASCICPDGNTDRYYSDRLPIVNSNLKIYKESSSLIAKLATGSAIELQLTTTELRVSTFSYDDAVSVDSSPLVGCFSCLTGATTTLNCRSSLHDIHVAITCDDAPRGIIKCSPRGHHTDLVLNLDSPDIDIVCFAGPEGDNATSFPIKGTLFYAPVISIHNPHNTSSFVSFVPYNPDSSFSLSTILKPFEDLFSLITFPLKHPYSMIFILISIIIIALILFKNRYFTISTKTE